MEYAFIALLVCSIGLMVLSFFRKDKVKELENQLEQLSLQFMQETYQLKKKIKILEEELLQTEMAPVSFSKPNTVNPTSMTQSEKVLSLYKLGLTVEQISKVVSLSTEDVRSLLSQSEYHRGFHYDK
jgi:cell division septum initiation protein DivIVA